MTRKINVNPQSFGYEDLEDMVIASGKPVELPENAVFMADLADLAEFTGLSIEELQTLPARELNGWFDDMAAESGNLYDQQFGELYA